MGEGKALPLGPECLFNGKNIPCFCCCSDSGTITGTLLRNMLEAIDKLAVYDHSTGLDPFLLLDGHVSGRAILNYFKISNLQILKFENLV